jgi:fermentation-respiration switch protein FrsA (DUF1100 family)
LVLKWLAVLAAVWLITVALAWLFQRSLIYFPMTKEPPPASAFPPGGEHVSFVNEDGIRLGGWFLPAAGEASGATVLLFNGNAGDRSFRVMLAEALAGMGASVLLWDYRGYGGNQGYPSEKGLAKDAVAARAYLNRRDDVDPERIVYFGESLGCGVAVRLAVERPPAAMILRSPFTSLADVGQRHFFFLPVRLLLKDRFSCVDRIDRVRCPLLFIAGERDGIVPARFSKRLYEAAGEPKRLVMIPGADHNDAALFVGDRLLEEVARFLAALDSRPEREEEPS